MSPFCSDNDFKIESSIFNNSFLSDAFFLTISIFFYSKFGFSSPTNIANI